MRGGDGKGWHTRALAGVLAALACAGALASGEPARRPQGPIAVITDVDGKVRVERAGRAHALSALELLERADQLVLTATARVEVAFFSGAPRVFLLHGPGRFALRDDDVVALGGTAQIEVRDLAAAWRTLQIRPGLVGRASVALRGASGARLEVQSPVGGQLDEDLDALRWKPPYGRDAERWQYAVRLIDARGAVLFAAQTQATALALPAQLPWQREQPYLWTVDATADDGRRAGAATEFVLVDQDTQTRMHALVGITEQARAQTRSAGATAEEVLLALALDQAGLRSRADRQWRLVASTRAAFAAPAAPAR